MTPADRTDSIAIVDASRTSCVLRCDSYPAVHDQVARARRRVRQVVGEHPRADDAVLLVNELATNVVAHAGAPAFTVVIAETVDGDLKIVVIDNGTADTTPHLCGSPAYESTSGRGMRLVDHLADRWGICRRRGNGLAVWFTLASRPGPVDGDPS